jgi:hypothetical protein
MLSLKQKNYCAVIILQFGDVEHIVFTMLLLIADKLVLAVLAEIKLSANYFIYNLVFWRRYR